MKRLFVLLACCAAVVLVVAFVPVLAQNGGYLHVINVVRPPVAHSTFSASGCLGGAVTSVPMDCFQFVDSKSSTARDLLIVGRSPFNRGKTTTTVNVMIVPIVLTIGSTVFDPTAVDACFESGTATDLSLFQNSPIFQNVIWDGGVAAGHGAKMNGVNVGTGTYNDAVRRAESWAFVGGSNYHTAFNVTTHSAIAINSTSIGGGGITFSSGCGTLGVLYLNPAGPGGDWDFYVQNTLIPSLGITATTFPVFLLKNVVLSLSNPPTIASCCVLGYHGAFGSVPGSEWTYSPMDFDTTGDFGAAVSDTSVPSHEVGEWLDDPLGGNPTPAWGNIGQVGGCQGNWEVGDPLSGTNFPAVVMPNGFTYHLQELAFFSWFYNGHTTVSAPSIGTGGLFSNNGTFAGASQPCPPGGTFTN